MKLCFQIILFLFKLTGICGAVKSSILLNYYKNIINMGIQRSVSFHLPTDARMYEAKSSPIREYGTFDFVIIGCGTAGSVLASRLTEINHFKVLALEAGEYSDNGFIQFTKLFYPFHLFTKYNWGYNTVSSTTACLGYVNESCIVPSGKGVGGGSLINGAIYSRGDFLDFNEWAEITQDPSWSYENVLEYFKKTENFHWTNPIAPVDLDYHGTSGPMNVQHRIPHFNLTDFFLAANEELGYKITDYNGADPFGSSIFQYFTKKGRRQDMGTVFIKPNLKRPNLKVLTGSYVIKIEIDHITKVAESVVFTHSGHTYRVKARKEVILSAGTISSPHILMLSGVGPKQHLESLGIPVVADLKVGDNLMEHPSVNLQFSSNVNPPLESLEDQIRDYINGIGTLTATITDQSVGFYELYPGAYLEIFLYIVDPEFTSMTKFLTKFKDGIVDTMFDTNATYLNFIYVNLKPKSTGTVRLKSTDPFEYPLIDLNLLSDANDEDIEMLYKSIQFLFSLSETSAYKKLGLQYLSKPLKACKMHPHMSKDYWYCHIRQICQSAFHPVGTCAMGAKKESGAVVDSNLKVFGIEKLRVVDASIFPTITKGHTCMPVVMIAEKISDLIKLDYSV